MYHLALKKGFSEIEANAYKVVKFQQISGKWLNFQSEDPLSVIALESYVDLYMGLLRNSYVVGYVGSEMPI